MNVYGYVNGKAVYSSDEYVFERRHFGPITNDEELIRFAEKCTCGWSDAGWKRRFRDFFLSDYALAEPYASLTESEFARLKELQKIARDEYKKAEAAREWKLVDRIYWADNSEEEIWEDKDGVRKTVMAVGPHGDAC